MTFSLLLGDSLPMLQSTAAASVQCVVTSPPYWGLRDYGLPPMTWDGDAAHEHEWGDVGRAHHPGQVPDGKSVHVENAVGQNAGSGSFCFCGAWLGCLGLEPTPELYVEHIVTIFREVRRVLRPDGTLWLNIGDSYANDSKWGGSTGGKHVSALHGEQVGRGKRVTGLKGKDLVGIPWMLAFALRADGWYLRSEIIWNKPNPMPESVTDRPTKAHETIFLLSKSERYFYDQEAIAEPSNGFSKMPDGCDTGPSAHGSFHRQGREKGARTLGRKSEGAPDEVRASASARTGRGAGWRKEQPDAPTRNKRSVWTIATQPFPEAHFATFPEEIPRTCILAGSRPGDLVLDPFSGAGTTGVAALALGRNYVGFDLNPDYIEMSRRRLEGVAPMFAKEATK